MNKSSRTNAKHEVNQRGNRPSHEAARVQKHATEVGGCSRVRLLAGALQELYARGSVSVTAKSFRSLGCQSRTWRSTTERLVETKSGESNLMRLHHSSLESVCWTNRLSS